MTGAGWGLSSLVQVSKIIPTVVTQFKNLGQVISLISNPAVASSIGGVGTAIGSIGGFSAIALPTLLAVSAALVGIVELVDYIENKDVRKLESLSSAIQDTNDKIAEMSGVGSEYDTLINNADKLTEKEQERLGVLQAQLDTLKEQAAEQEAAYLKEWQSQQTEQKTETTHKLVTGSADEVPEGAQKLYGQYWDVVTTTEYTESQRAAENLRTAINNLNSEKRLGVTVGSEYISKLQGIIDEYQETYDTTIKVRDAGYELDDSQEYLVKVMEHQKEVISGLGAEYAQNSEDIGQFANSLDESASKLDAYIAALDEYRGANENAADASGVLVNSLFDANGQLTEAAQQALTADGAMASMAQSFIQSQMQAAQADYSTLILAIQEVGNAAMITSAQLANMMAMAGVGGSTSDMKRTYQIKYGKSAEADPEAYNKWLSSTLADAADAKYRYRMQELQKQLEQVSGYVPSSGGGSSKSAEEKAAEEAEKQAKKAQQAQEKAAKESQSAYESAAKSAEQAAQEAARAAEQAAEEAKRKILDSIQELKDASDKFWDSKTDSIEETNKELDRQKQLEEKLKALEEAKQKKIILYKNGQFQYDKDYGTIAKSQADYEETRDKIQRERELEQLEEMKDNATEIFNEMKDIVQNGGNVTQEMINNWLKNMAASGANYYDSNKKLLNEWLDWAKDAIKAFGQATVEAAGGAYTSTSSLMSSGSYSGSSATATDTNGAGYLNDPMYWDKDGNFVGFATAWWIDRFDKQMKSGFKPEEWLGGGLGTNLFDDWEEVFKYWAENTTDPYALQDMADRLKAAQIVMSNYKDLFKSLGYDEYYQLAEKAEAIDPTKISKMGWGAGAIAHPDDPFGWRSITASDIKGSATGELYSLLRDISDYEWIRSDADIVSDISAAFKAYRTSKQGAATGYSGEVEFDTTNLKAFFDDNNKRLEELGQLWFDASEEQRKLLEQEAEARRKAGELAAGQLGIEGASEIYEAQREANRQAGGIMEARQQQKKNAKNIESIEEILQAVEKGQDISDGYINSAKDYLAKAIKENREASDKLYSDTEKAKLDAQNEQMKDISDRLNNIQESGVSIKTTDLLEGETTPWEDQFDKEDIQDWLRDEDFDKDLETKRAQMLANAEAWWNATTQEERDALHKANEALAKEIGGLTYDSSSGIWSKHATGTHNARGGLSIVGERGPEMRILNKGDNIIPANQTANLWKWSNTTPQAVLSTLSSRNGACNTSYAFDVSRIELPNVTDAKSFVQGLKNYALQYSYKR